MRKYHPAIFRSQAQRSFCVVLTYNERIDRQRNIHCPVHCPSFAFLQSHPPNALTKHKENQTWDRPLNVLSRCRLSIAIVQNPTNQTLMMPNTFSAQLQTTRKSKGQKAQGCWNRNSGLGIYNAIQSWIGSCVGRTSHVQNTFALSTSIK